MRRRRRNEAKESPRREGNGAWKRKGKRKRICKEYGIELGVGMYCPGCMCKCTTRCGFVQGPGGREGQLSGGYTSLGWRVALAVKRGA